MSATASTDAPAAGPADEQGAAGSGRGGRARTGRARTDRARTGWALACIAGMATASVTLQLVGIGPQPHRPPAELWFYDRTPLDVRRVGGPAAKVMIMASLVVLAALWLALGALVRRHPRGARLLLLGAVATALPMAVGPPLSSDDVYSYAGAGAMVHQGFDPYVQGAAVLGSQAIARDVNPFWRDSPSPYGPLPLDAAWLVDVVSGSRLLLAVVLHRLLAVVALVGTVALLWRACAGDERRRLGMLWLLAANPLVLLSIVSAAHNDALLLLPVAGALLLALRGHPVVAVAVAAVAGQVKVTGLVVCAVLGCAWAWQATGAARRMRRAAAAAAVALCTSGVVGVVSLRGFGWIHDIDVPAKAVELFTPVNALADLLPRLPLIDGAAAAAVRVSGAGDLRHLCQAVALVLGGGVVLAMLLAARKLGVVRAAGLAALAVVALGPVLWPWYLLLPLTIIALGGSRVERAVVAGWSVLLLLPLLPSASVTAGHPDARLLTPERLDVVCLGALMIGVVLIVAQRGHGISRRSRRLPAGRMRTAT